MLFNHWLNMKLKEVGKTWRDFTKAGIGGQTMYNIQHGKYRTLKDGTCQKLALVLGLCQGDIRDAIVQSIKEEDAPKETEATEQVESVEQDEPEELPFDDLPEEEPEEGEDMKWFEDIPKAPETEAPMKVKIKVKPELEKLAKENPGAIESTIEKSVEEALEHFRPVNETNIADDDSVNHPSHYTQGTVECIDAIESSMTPEEFRGYLKGCQIKYIWRYQHKGGMEDLKKARWYLDRLIKFWGGKV